jgi:hypothetical protein
MERLSANASRSPAIKAKTPFSKIRRSARLHPKEKVEDYLFFLQKNLGNRAVDGLLKSEFFDRGPGVVKKNTKPMSESVVRTFEPRVNPPAPLSVEVSPPVVQREGETGTAAAGPRCSVKSFGLSMDPWSRAWPDGSGFYSLQLPVSFSLTLNDGCSRNDCLIGQDKKGQVEYSTFRSMGGINIPIIDRRINQFSNWTTDAPPGKNYWWDGANWNAGLGSWGFTWFGLANESASFNDESGFASPSILSALARTGYSSGITASSFPIYWGGVNHSGHFQYRTYVKDRNTGTTIRQLTWGILINYQDPSTGAHYFYL